MNLGVGNSLTGIQRLLSCVEQEDGWPFVEVLVVFFPLADGLRADKFRGCGEVCGDAEKGAVVGVLEDVFQELVVAVGSFDEELGLLFFGGNGFEVFDGFGSVVGFNGQVADELEVLSVHAGGHEGEKHGVGAYHRHHGGLYLVGCLYHKVAGVRHGGAAGFADDADGVSFLQESLSLRGVWGMVLVHEQELQGVDVDVAVEGFEEPAGGAFVFDEEDAQLPHRIGDVRRQAEKRVCAEDRRN